MPPLTRAERKLWEHSMYSTIPEKETELDEEVIDMRTQTGGQMPDKGKEVISMGFEDRLVFSRDMSHHRSVAH